MKDEHDKYILDLPTIEEVKALDGKISTMLTEREIQVLGFCRKQGRKFGVSISIMKSANSRIQVSVQPPDKFALESEK